jgi:hypothetical protein
MLAMLKQSSSLVTPGQAMRPPSCEAARPSWKASAWASLLEQFYGRAGMPLFPLERLSGDQVPPPYKDLLVHSLDMTPTLERFYGDALRIQVLSRHVEQDTYLREVVLQLRNTMRPVEYGVIRVCLNHFPSKARRMVLDEEQPLGGILLSESIGHMSWPQAFFRAEADAHLCQWLQLPRPCSLYGRRNLLVDGSRRILADVMEILSPVENPTSQSS